MVDWNKLKVLNQKRRSCGLFKRNKSGEGREAAEKGKRIEDWEGRGGKGGGGRMYVISNHYKQMFNSKMHHFINKSH